MGETGLKSWILNLADKLHLVKGQGVHSDFSRESLSQRGHQRKTGAVKVVKKFFADSQFIFKPTVVHMNHADKNK
jgi:hypothetical protein